MRASATNPSVAIVGGGLAGLSAGCVLADSGFRVQLFERKPYLGGRASSYEHPGTGEVVDNCQHVLLGCCTNLVRLYRLIGVEQLIRWYDRLTFIEPGGKRSVIASSLLPAPLHTAPSFLRATNLSFADKASITRAMLALVSEVPDDDGPAFLDWLRTRRQTPRAIERFWKTVLVSALNEDLERISAASAAMVFRESFLKSAGAGRLGLPTVSLSSLYGHAGEYIQQRGGAIELRTAVQSLEIENNHVKIWAEGREFLAEFCVLALPFDAVARLLPQAAEAGPLRDAIAHFQTSPITGIHLWFDRVITELDHAVLLDRTIQWMFHKSRILSGYQGEGSYLELVVSASKSLLELPRGEIVDLALRELAEFFPPVSQARLLKSTVVKEVHATYAPLPGMEAHRPPPETLWSRVFLAGDWIATGWPATMEGAVRSGWMAAESLAQAKGMGLKFLQPALPARGFMRWLDR